jgi:hypothetical protein
LIDRIACATIFCTLSPASTFPTEDVPNNAHSPLDIRIPHGLHHGSASVGHAVDRCVGHDVGRKTLPEYTSWAAGARPINIPARAAALMLCKDASSLRALGFTTASLLRMATASLPAPRSRRAPAGRGKSQKQRNLRV